MDFFSADWKRLDQLEERTVFQTREWTRFVSETQNATPVLAELRDGNEVVGYFTGLTFTRFGVRILGSSFPGWTNALHRVHLVAGVLARSSPDGS